MADFQFLDKRVQKTKITLFESFFIVLKKKPYRDIKITDIILQANCSRATFYTHYNHKDHLLEEITQYLFKEMIRAYRSTYVQGSMIDIQNLTDEPLNLLSHFMHFGEYYQLLLGEHLQMGFREKITNIIIQLYLEEFEIQPVQGEGKVDGDLLERYCGYGLAGIILDWVKDDFPIEPEALSREITKVFKHSLGTIRVKKRSYNG